jgi:uncharacterized membrane protein
MGKLNLQMLRRGVLIGLGVVLIVDFLLSTRVPSGTGLGIIVLLVMIAAVFATAWFLMPEAAGAVFRNKDLLVPLALVLVLGKILSWLSAAPVLGALLNPSLPLHLFSLSLSLSLGFLLQIALAVAYAAWMTAALWTFARTGQTDPVQSWPRVRTTFWRCFGLEFIGWAATLVATALILMTMPVLGFVALIPLAAFALVWNGMTAAVLPVGLEYPGNFWESFRAGVRVSLAEWRSWGWLLLVQMLLLGWVFFYYSSWRGNTNVSWSVNVFWTGGFVDECKWYGKLADVRKVAVLPLVETLLTLLFGAFAVAIKLAILQRLKKAVGTR